MFPEWDGVTGNLPEGEHAVEWHELEAKLGFTERRRRLLPGLRDALDMLRNYGCRRVWIDGSFVTDKPDPGDFDCCWDYVGVRLVSLQTDHPVFFDFSAGRAAQKQLFGGEFFLATAPADQLGTRFLDFFQIDKHTGTRKGILLVNLAQQLGKHSAIDRNRIDQ